jgi:UPF0271 protein
MVPIAKAIGLKTAEEVFGDRNYSPDGTLSPRNKPNAMIEDVNVSIKQVLQMVQTGTLTANDGTIVKVQADTLCIHGDQPGAVMFAKAIREALQAAGIEVGV